MPVCIEGYAPPSDNRIEKFMITPDPGVIEVNIMPAASWPELVRNTEILYEEARQTRLGTEKFMLDGRFIGLLTDALDVEAEQDVAHRSVTHHHDIVVVVHIAPLRWYTSMGFRSAMLD